MYSPCMSPPTLLHELKCMHMIVGEWAIVGGREDTLEPGFNICRMKDVKQRLRKKLDCN